ncbi:5-oxoprolinase subunit PxpB [Microbacterium sp. YY-03]|uniref:5-oxoprolinase subunit PxpB n=1 Tax=Microbacterium sp. YY-03 TaxID=3421636 RepID=UPI003D162876
MTAPQRILPVGQHAVLAEYATLADTMAAFAGLPPERPEGVIDVVPAARTILVNFAVHVSRAEVEEWLGSADASAVLATQPVPIDIDVVYNGDDLDEVATLLGLSRDTVVSLHTESDYRVAFTGFAPGFAYLVAPDTRLHVPRRSSPRPRVPAGAVGLAGEFSGVYPRATPGGWQLIGHTGTALWDSEREQPALLHPGDAVRFRAVRRSVSLATPHMAKATIPGITVIKPGLQLLVQDLGRPGHAADGVTASGAADRAAHNAANTAVGNPRTAATLELALGGAELHFDVDAVVAITGANAPATLTTPGADVDGSPDVIDTPIAPGTPTAIPAGGTLTFGYASRGVRTYLAVRGGWAAPSTLTSQATDTLSGLGPAPITAGTRVGISPTQPSNAVTPVVPAPTPLAAPADTVTLDVTFGPRADSFTAQARETLTSADFIVSATSDRVGLRLESGTLLERINTAELPSEGVVRGAIQVPANGQPVIFLADHPVTGGYPVIAVVVPRHRDIVAQVPAGTTVRFRAI